MHSSTPVLPNRLESFRVRQPTIDPSVAPDDTRPDRRGSPNVVSTGTTTVAVRSDDVAVLAADTRASLGGRFVTNRSARKVEPVADRIAVAFSGSVSDAQSFVPLLRTELSDYEHRHDGPPTVRTAAIVAGDLVRRGPFHALELLLAGVDEEGAAVYQIGGGGGVMETPAAAGGSGMQLAYGVLENDYEPSLQLTALQRLTAAAVHTATERDTASGDGMTVATITADSLEVETFADLEAAVGVAAPANDDDHSSAETTDEGNEEVR